MTEKINIKWDLGFHARINKEEFYIPMREALSDKCIEIENKYKISTKDCTDAELYNYLVELLNLPSFIIADEQVLNYVENSHLLYENNLAEISQGFIPSEYEVKGKVYTT